ncbi:MAG: MOSC domain-containing protein [Synergistaceae bacterium]|nr:MOSC domain-containing protein [Synergistaceae bacterium]
MGRVTAVCTSSVRQEPKVVVDSIRLIEGGVEGDSHFGLTEREVSLLRAEDIREAELEAGFPFPAGSLAENLIVEGLPPDLAPGARIALGESAVLEVVEKGKKPGEPHSYDYRGWCLLPTVGFFLRVIKEGGVSTGDEVVLLRGRHAGTAERRPTI